MGEYMKGSLFQSFLIYKISHDKHLPKWQRVWRMTEDSQAGSSSCLIILCRLCSPFYFLMQPVASKAPGNDGQEGPICHRLKKRFA